MVSTTRSPGRLDRARPTAQRSDGHLRRTTSDARPAPAILHRFVDNNKEHESSDPEEFSPAVQRGSLIPLWSNSLLDLPLPLHTSPRWQTLLHHTLHTSRQPQPSHTVRDRTRGYVARPPRPHVQHAQRRRQHTREQEVIEKRPLVEASVQRHQPLGQHARLQWVRSGAAVEKHPQR